MEIGKLKKWFLSNRRPLPWRENPSPYEVWVSEVMLQQTQVGVVIPYFKRWMQTFPTISTLARAPIEQVIKLWEGLGYYSRARNLHAGARYLLEFHGAELPDDPVALSRVKGVGPYTRGAILSFAFKQRAAAVDGNVLRVMARLLGIEEEVDKGEVKRQIPIILAGGKVLRKKGQRGKVMADLWEFPYYEKGTLLEHFPLPLRHMKKLKQVSHGFTRYRALLSPDLYWCEDPSQVEGHSWMPLEEVEKLPFSSGHKRVLSLLINLPESIHKV